MNDFSPYEQKYGLPPGLLNRVMNVESGGNPNAVSPKGAQGLFQFMPNTAKELGIDPLNPDQAAEGAARYLRQNYDRFGNNWDLALAAYNAGPGNVQKYGGVPPFQETQNYIQKVGLPQHGTGDQSFAQQGQSSGWKSRATPVQAQQQGGWKSRATAIQPELSLGQRITQSWDRRDQEMQDAADRYNAGEQGLASTLYQGANAFASKVPDAIGETIMATPILGPTLEAVGEHVISPVVNAVSNLPTLDPENPTLGDLAKSTAEEYPTIARNLLATGQLVNTLGTAVGAGEVTRGLGASATRQLANKSAARQEIGKLASQGPAPTPKSFTEISKENYQLADEIGGKFSANEVSDKFATAMQDIMPKPIAGKTLTSEDMDFIKNLREYEGLKGESLTLSDIDRLDKSLTQKINDKFIDAKTGQPNNTGRQLMGLQTKLRQIVEEVPGNAGNQALINGRAAWQAQKQIDDLDLVAERASFSQGDQAKALQRGYASLYMDKDRIRGWSPEAKELLKKAATPGVTMELLRPLTSRLTALIAGGTGNLVGAATANLGGMALRGVNEAYVASQGAKVQRAIKDNALSKIKPVEPPEPVGPLLLASPDKMGPLPMSDAEISFSQRLLQNPGNRASPEASGNSTIRPPVSQMTQLQDTLKGNKAGQFNNMRDALRAGTLSQNKFVDQAQKSFGLSPTEARNLAREVKTYKGEDVPSTTPLVEPVERTPSSIIGKKDSNDVDADFGNIIPDSLKKDKGLKYTSRVYTGPESNVRSNHYFMDKDYYSHVRFSDDTKGSRYVHEVQSDIHGKGKKWIGDDDEAINDLVRESSGDIIENWMDHIDIEEDWDIAEGYMKSLQDFISEEVVPSNEDIKSLYKITDDREIKAIQRDIKESIDMVKEMKGDRVEFTDKDPKWLRNTLNNTIDDAIDEGKTFINFNIDDSEGLFRSEGVKKWYHDSVVNTLKKISNSRNLKAELTDDGYFSIQLKKGK